jgi:hypothetical protein
VGEAEKEIMAAFEAISLAKVDMNSDDLFWIDPWSAQGQAVSAKLLPQAQELRRHAERAIVLVAEARSANPGLKEQDALNAMDLGARRLDMIGMKFQLAQEIVDGYAQAQARPRDKAHESETGNILEEISSMNGRCQDLRDAYSATRDEYRQVWLSENRPYWLSNVTVRYDLAIQEWQRRGSHFQEAIRDFESGKELPPITAFGLAAAAAK